MTNYYPDLLGDVMDVNRAAKTLNGLADLIRDITALDLAGKIDLAFLSDETRISQAHVQEIINELAGKTG